VLVISTRLLFYLPKKPAKYSTLGLHEWLRKRQQQEGLWLGDDKLAQPGMSNVNPLDQPKAKSEKPKPTVSPVKMLKPKRAAKALKRMPGVKATQTV